MERSRPWAALLLLLCLWRGAEGFFNTDIREPIFRKSPGVTNRDHFDMYGEDFFGYAIAFHPIMDVVRSDSPEQAAGKIRLFVGAPKGTYPGGLDISPATGALNKTGLVYSCPLLPGTNFSCDPVMEGDATGVMVDEITVTDTNDFLSAGQRMFDFRPNADISTAFGTKLQAEQKTNQLMGATIFSRSDSLLVCAPTWTSTGVYNFMLSPDDNTPATSNALPQGRCYLANQDLSDVTFLDPCNVEGEANVKVDRGYCTAGTDVDMLEPGRIVIGAPGFSQGIGALFYGENQEQMMARGDDRLGRIGLGNTAHVSAQTEGVPEEILETSQGFQVATGYITQSRMSTTSPPNSLASVPRFDSTQYKGKVDIYDARLSGGDILVLLPIAVEGQQIAEFFGYALATADLNGDGWDEVIVGAPMYSRIVPDSEVQVEIGRVYIFKNTGDGNLTTEPIIFEGTVYQGRLGMNILNIGDIDLDGYEDIAVSAPYESVGDHTGVVYIYYGAGSDAVFESQIPAKVTAEEVGERLNVSLETFGFSLSALDMDNNQYNDLAIGVVDSSAVVVLRSRPVANVETMVTPSMDSINLDQPTCNVDGVMYPCFNVTVSIGVTGVGIPNEISVEVILREIRSSNGQRLFFSEDVDVTSVRSNLTREDLFNTTVYVLNDVIDTASPLRFIVEVEQHEVPVSPPPTSGNPVINDLSDDYIIRQPATAEGEVILVNNCGEDFMCQTDFSLTHSGTVFANDTHALPNVEPGEDIIEADVTIVNVSFVFENLGDEDARVLFLNISLSDDQIFQDDIIVDIDGQVMMCRDNILCHLDDFIVGTPEKTVLVTFRIKSVPTEAELDATFTITSTGTMDNNATNNMVTIHFKLERRVDLALNVKFSETDIMYANNRPDNVMFREDVNSGDRSLIRMQMNVTNFHGTPVDPVLTIYYPARSDRTGDNFFLLPSCSVEIEEGTVNCDNAVLNGISELPCNGNRRKRAVRRSSKQQRRTVKAAGLQRTTRETIGLDCENNPEDCLSIRCTITQLQGRQQSTARISLIGYVDDRFFAGRDDTYVLTAYATLELNATAKGVIDIDNPDRPDEGSVTLTLTPPSSTSSTEDESITTIVIVIIVVIIGGILLVIIVAVILLRLGFFKRKKKHELLRDEGEGTQGPVVATVPEPGAPDKQEGATL